MNVNRNRAASRVTVMVLLLKIGFGSLFLAGCAPADADNPVASSTYQGANGSIANTSAIDESTPFEAPFVSVVGREVDGTTVVKAQYVAEEIETKVRTEVRDGRTIEQVYGLITPVIESVTVRVPPGKDIFHYLRQQYRQRMANGELVAGGAVCNRDEEQPYEQLLYQIVERHADGTAIVEIELPVLDAEPKISTRKVVRDGKSVELLCVSADLQSRPQRVSVPPGEDILAYVIGAPSTWEALRRWRYPIDSHFDPPEELYEIMAQQPDGSTRVRCESLGYDQQTQTRKIVRDGQAAVQVYELLIPERQSETIELPPGQGLVDYLHERYGIEDDSEGDVDVPAPPVPDAPSGDEDFIPPPPSVGV